MNSLIQRLVATAVGTALLLGPHVLAAQPRAYVEGLSELTTAVAGTYGDEGSRIAPALDKMAAALAQWDREILAVAAQVASAGSDDAPSVVRLRVTLAAQYAQRGRLTDALRELDVAIRLDPRATPAHLLRGQLLEASSQTAEAAEAFQRAWRLDTHDPLAAYYVLRHAARIDADDVHGAENTLIAAYRTLLTSGAYQKSAPFFSTGALQEHAGDAAAIAPVIYSRAYACVARGEYAEAIVEFRRAAATDPLVTDPFSRSAAMLQAVAAFREGRTTEARTLLAGFSDIARDSSEAHRVMGLIHWADAEYDPSVEALRTAIAKNPRDERSRVALARVLSSAGRTAEAERALHETLDMLPESTLARLWLASAYEKTNRVAEAQQLFEHAAAGVTTHRDAFFASIARLASASGDLSTALDAWQRSVAASPNDPDLHKHLARALLQQDRGDEALRELLAVLLIDPLDAGAHLGVGQVHLNAGRNEDAVLALTHAVRLLPGYTEARYALATALSRAGRASEAAQEFERVEQAQRQDLADRRRALMLATIKEEAALRTAEGDYDRAATLWTQVIEREPGGSLNHLNLATALAKSGRIDTAIEQYTIALRLGADPLVYRELAALYATLGRTAEASHARALYTEALQRDVVGESRVP